MMRKVLAFLVWLFSFWTWKDFFLRWCWRPPFYPANGETADLEHLPSQEGHPESEWARFLSSLPEDERWCTLLEINRHCEVSLGFGPNSIRYHPNMQAGYREFLGAVASSEVVFREELYVYLEGDDSLKHAEAFVDALCQSASAFRKLRLNCYKISAIPFVKWVSSALLENDAIQDLHLYLYNVKEKMDKEVATEFMAIVAVPHIFRILKSFAIFFSHMDSEGWEQLMKPFHSPDSALEELDIGPISSDAQLEHISDLLTTNTSLKKLSLGAPPVYYYYFSNLKVNEFVEGYTSIASALCSNRSLQVLRCRISGSMELKVLLDPLMPKTNNLQPNTTLTCLVLTEAVGGKEGIETLVDMLRTNMSLLDLTLEELHELSSNDEQAIENVLAILEALKTNKSLKKIDFQGCTGVGGYKVLGAMMDLLLENHCIEDIELWGTPLKESRDAEYVYSTLSKRKKMKLWGIVQGMANVKPTSGRVFLCGQPFAGKTRLRLSIKQLKEFQQKDEV